ncbi:MAG: hypothetical protein RL095_2492 [Verrucomicrobiota bacterium]|jgi:hypothetical protein
MSSRITDSWRIHPRLQFVAPATPLLRQSVGDVIAQVGCPALILVPDDIRLQEWVRDLQGACAPFHARGENQQISVLRYGDLANVYCATQAQRQEAANLRAAEIALVSREGAGVGNLGDLDAISAAAQSLVSEPIQGIDTYLRSLEAHFQPENGAPAFGPEWYSPLFGLCLHKLKENGTGIVIADAWHRAGLLWGQVLEIILAELGNPFTLALPSHRGDAEGERRLWDQRKRLFPGQALEMKTPALVSAGALRPWRELAWLCEPDPDEIMVMKGALAEWHEALMLLNGPSVSITLDSFARNELGNIEHDIPGNWGRRRAFTESLLQFYRSQGETIPKTFDFLLEKIPDNGIEGSFVFIRDYIFRQLLCSSREADHHAAREAITKLAAIGCVLTESGVTKGASPVPNLLDRSRSRERAVCQILEKDWSHLGDTFSALVVCDSAAGSANAGIYQQVPAESFAPCSLRSVFSSLRGHPVTLQLNPIAILGMSIYCDARFLNLLATELGSELAPWGSSVNLGIHEQDGWARLTLSGPAAGNDVLHHCIRKVLLHRVSSCLIGTRELLGSSWDPLAVNTVVNLCSGDGHLFWHRLQMRAADPRSGLPTPLANLWDVICSTPDVPQGMEPYLRLNRRKTESFHLAEDGLFEEGITHLCSNLKAEICPDPATARDVNTLSAWSASQRQEGAAAWMALGIQDPKLSRVVEISFVPELESSFRHELPRPAGSPPNTPPSYASLAQFIGHVVQTLAAALCDNSRIPWRNDLVKSRILPRRHGSLRLFISCDDREFRRDLISACEEIFATPGGQNYLLAGDYRNPAGRKILLPVPKTFASKEVIGRLGVRWQQFIGPCQFLGLRTTEVRRQLQTEAAQATPLLFGSRLCQVWIASS